MKGLTKIILIAMVVSIIGGGIFLITWDIPVPSRQVEKVLDDDQFPQ